MNGFDIEADDVGEILSRRLPELQGPKRTRSDVAACWGHAHDSQGLVHTPSERRRLEDCNVM